MAELINKDQKIVIGKLIKVANQNKHTHENEVYVSLQVEDQNGENERCLLFTEIQMADIEKVSFQFALGNMKRGRLYEAQIDKKRTFLIKIKNYTDDEMILRLSPSQLKKAQERAFLNPEDNTKKSWLTDLTD